jgi:hypothetical protein
MPHTKDVVNRKGANVYIVYLSRRMTLLGGGLRWMAI